MSGTGVETTGPLPVREEKVNDSHLGNVAGSEKIPDVDVITGTCSLEFGGDEKVPDTAHTDIGWDLYQQALLLDPEEREVIAKRVKRKIDCILLPMMCFVYFLSFLDKQTLNYANAYGLQADLGMKGTDYSWVASITNIGYLVCAYPSNVALQKFPIGKFVACSLMTWGGLLMCTTGVHNFRGLLAIRFLLGGAEACIGPAWMLLTSMFWTREEQPFRMSNNIRAWWLGCNGLSTMVGAGLSWGFGHSHGSIKPWQLVFLVVGIVSFSAGVVGFFVIPSSQRDCIFLTKEEKMIAVWRVSGNRTGIKNEKILWYQIRESVVDIKLYFIAVLALCLGILNGSVANFLSALLSGFGYDSLKVLLYQLPGGAIQFTCTITAGLLNSYYSGILCLSIILGFIPGLSGMIAIATVSLNHRLGLTACAWLQTVFGLSIILTWTLVATNVAGHTKRTTANGVLFVFYAAGNIIGPFLFISSEKPRYLTAIKSLAGMYAGGMLMATCLYITMALENRKRDRNPIPMLEETANEDGFADMTDKENKAFRYKL